ncbi:hypothetical protein DACRYDRAFT_22184 [Dacryopinax primogenitus]|uniref:Uncharacterized protein n=1 Tax=Dacryopinax primogenitus (strain DJM 731) TaxID=1858805 RepID=M5FZ58_DACPD|nr:uncharacterized protein DACRYDRAFT_22184 [Dacryopinax primogenitus]EJU01794.1 hypothetical protein DACRYDRAFT_22184 [Dacryopinax primogenitus]
MTTPPERQRMKEIDTRRRAAASIYPPREGISAHQHFGQALPTSCYAGCDQGKTSDQGSPCQR